MSSDVWADLQKLMGAEHPELQRARDELETTRRQLAEARRKIKNVLELIADPEQSHRMLTRRELQRLLR